MPQTSQKFQILSQSPTGSFVAVVNPILEARSVTLRNPDVAADLEFCTDTSDANAICVIPAGTERKVSFSTKAVRGFLQNEVVGYIRGGGVPAILIFEA